MEVTLVILLTFWLVCGFLAYGKMFGYFQQKYPNIAESRRGLDRQNALTLSFFGPIGLLTALLCCQGYSMRWRDPR